jgi:RNase adaptor protein for sRNA GlmZ degradation
LSLYQTGQSGNSAYYFNLNGTSMATAVVSGAAAVLLQKFPSLTPDQVKARLMKTATKTFPGQSTATDPATGKKMKSRDGNALDGIRAERKALSNLREVADRILDTTTLTVHQLKDRLVELYVAPKARTGLAPTLVSFGFKHGVPFDADLVFDVRFLPNPHFVDALRALDGRDERVRTFVLSHPESKELLRRLEDFLRFVLPCYEREGKAYLTVAIGCTGGRHRSVTVAEELRRFLAGLGYTPTVVHRDLQRE